MFQCMFSDEQETGSDTHSPPTRGRRGISPPYQVRVFVVSDTRSRTHGHGLTVSDTRSRTHGLGPTVPDAWSRTHGLGRTASDSRSRTHGLGRAVTDNGLGLLCSFSVVAELCSLTTTTKESWCGCSGTGAAPRTVQDQHTILCLWSPRTRSLHGSGAGLR